MTRHEIITDAAKTVRAEAGLDFMYCYAACRAQADAADRQGIAYDADMLADVTIDGLPE